MANWKPLNLKYLYKGIRVEEEAYLTIDLSGNQIIIAPTCGKLLASSPPGVACDLIALRAQAVATWANMTKAKNEATEPAMC